MIGMKKGKKVIVTFHREDGWKEPVHEVLDKVAEVLFLEDIKAEERKGHFSEVDALLSFMVHNEVARDEFLQLPEGTMIQTLLAGVDAVPYEVLPESAMICANAGAWAEPMAEHIVGMMLALGKNFLKCHNKLVQGEFYRDVYNTWFHGKTAGIIGFGGIGKATSRLMQAFGMNVMAINTSGKTEEKVDFIGTMNDLQHVLEKSDVVVVAVPLTRHTKGLIGKEELERMKPHSILINPARGPIIEEKALYEHMLEHPDFKVGIDAWWIEPHVQGEFRLNYPFFELENILGSPHNTNLVPEIYPIAVRRAAENVRRFLEGEEPRSIVDPADYESL